VYVSDAVFFFFGGAGSFGRVEPSPDSTSSMSTTLSSALSSLSTSIFFLGFVGGFEGFSWGFAATAFFAGALV
jgi:hypothetical protein